MAVGLAPGRKSATFWLFRTASTTSAPMTKVVLSLVAASAFGCDAVEKTDALESVRLVSVSFFVVHIRTSRRRNVYVKLLPSTSRTRSSYPAVRTLPSDRDASPETRFVCPSPVTCATSPVESYEKTRPSADPTRNVSVAAGFEIADVTAFWGPYKGRNVRYYAVVQLLVLFHHVRAPPSQASLRYVYRRRSSFLRMIATQLCPAKSTQFLLVGVASQFQGYTSCLPCAFLRPLA
jgi:hypothetical protein